MLLNYSDKPLNSADMWFFFYSFKF